MVFIGFFLVASGAALFALAVRGNPLGATTLTVLGLVLLFAGAYIKHTHPRLGIVEGRNTTSSLNEMSPDEKADQPRNPG